MESQSSKECRTVAEVAKRWGLSERSVRNYCAQGRIEGAILSGKTWQIPMDAEKPKRANARQSLSENTLLQRLLEEKAYGISGGIYHKLQIEFTYNSNHMEGSRLTLDQTRMIFETSTIGLSESAVNINDVFEAANHFRCIDYCLDKAKRPLSESMIKTFHRILKSAVVESGFERNPRGYDNFLVAPGEYKKLPNEVGVMTTASPEDVPAQMADLMTWYQPDEPQSLERIVDLHVRFERIHPFQDGNGRVGRLIMLKECLKNSIVPFIITDDLKAFYYRGLAQWDDERGYMLDTCLTAQDRFKNWLDYFRIEY